jgi:pyroglutamyl-peptidase
MRRRPRLLVVGFGPFPRMPRNPGAALARRIAAAPRWRLHGIDGEALVLSTTYATLDTELGTALDKGRFDALLMIGVAGRARTLRVERRAVNRSSILFPDAAGRRPARLAEPEAPSSRRAGTATPNALAILRRRGLACALSQDAGRYLCNAAYLRALAIPVPVLFIHIPRPPGLRQRRLTWEVRLAAGLTDVALDLLRHARHRAPSGGAVEARCMA